MAWLDVKMGTSMLRNLLDGDALGAVPWLYVAVVGVLLVILHRPVLLTVLWVLRCIEDVWLWVKPSDKQRWIKPGSVKRVAVIGAGASGIAAAKEALEAGFEVVVFEQSQYIGGLWVYAPKEGHSSVYESININTTKQLMSFSDYPMPHDGPTYPSHTEIRQYYEEYCAHFGVTECIRFNRQVVDIRQSEDAFPAFSPDDDQDWGSGGMPLSCQWTVTSVACKDGKPLYMTESDDTVQQCQRDVFDAVIVANGHHSTPNMPDLPGLSKYAGTVMHSHAYKKPVSDEFDFREQNVLVVGIGNSAVDIANELSHGVANDVLLSTRSGAWVIPKFIKGQCLDHILGIPRYQFRVVPRWLRDSSLLLNLHGRRIQSLIETHQGTMHSWGLTPRGPIMSMHPSISHELLHRVGIGAITIKPNVERFRKRSVIFADGSSREIDAVIMATGYRISFPFLPVRYQPRSKPSIMGGGAESKTRRGRRGSVSRSRKKSNRRKASRSSRVDLNIGEIVRANETESNDDVALYKYVFSPHTPATLVHVGLFQPVGATAPCSEMQSRWICQVWNGARPLPKKKGMLADIAYKKKVNQSRYLRRPRHTIQLDQHSYIEEIAELVGCVPKVTDALGKCCMALLRAPQGWPVTYRLSGPGAWKGAPNALLRAFSAYQRVGSGHDDRDMD